MLPTNNNANNSELTAEEKRRAYNHKKMLKQREYRRRKAEERRQQQENARREQEYAEANLNPKIILVSEIVPFNVGKMTMVCHHCDALYFERELNYYKNYKSCCNNGRISLVKEHDIPDFIKEIILNKHHHLHNNFMNLHHRLNAAFRFASVTANTDKCYFKKYIYRVNGPIHRCLRPIITDDKEPNLGQLYYTPKSTAIALRENKGNEKVRINREPITMFEEYLRNNNIFARFYRKLYKLLKTVESDPVEFETLNPSDFIIFFHDNANNNILPYDESFYSIFNLSDPNKPSYGLFLKFQAEKGTAFLPPDSMYNDPLCYPLLYPRGELGWQNTLKYTEPIGSRTNISLREYKRYYFHVRDGQFNLLFRLGKILQQLSVDSWIQVETRKIEFLRRHRPHLADVDTSILNESIQNNRNISDLGVPFKFPSSFIGSRANMRKRFLDAMTLCAEKGHPDLFITLVCNPHRAEITDNLFEGQSYQDRPDLIARSFNMVVQQFIADLTKKNILGDVVYHFYSVEFQKNGLPHIHLCLKFSDSHGIRRTSRIDQLISAEIPANEELLSLVIEHQMHGPCNDNCLINGRCKKRFPKKNEPFTKFITGQYPSYKRSDTLLIRNDILYSNKMVVPYSPQLLKRYESHVNVEVATSLATVKYLNKYINKTPERDSRSILDEAESYRLGRYVAAPEAMWRFFEYTMWEISHAVLSLPVHKEVRERVRVRLEIQRFPVEQEYKNSKLDGFFMLNQLDEEARQFTYKELPLHYVWKESTREWVRRRSKKGCIVSRVNPVYQKDREMVALRKLLLNVRGPQSFSDLRTVNNTLFDSYYEAAVKRNIIDERSAAAKVLEEARERLDRKRNLNLLALLLMNKMVMVHDSIVQANHHRYVEANEDFTRTLNNLLKTKKKQLVGLAVVPYTEPSPRPNLVTEVVSVRFTSRQEYIYNTITSGILSKRNNLFFIEGPGGCGKSFIIKQLINYCKSNTIKAKIVCPTGLAASLYSDGATIHSTFKVPRKITTTSALNLEKGTPAYEDVVDLEVLIIDEVSMVNVRVIEMIDEFYKRRRNSNTRFGGVTVIFSGDLRQLPLVYDEYSDLVYEKVVFGRSKYEREAEKFSLTENIRTNNDQIFQRWQLEVGEGRVGDRSGNSILLELDEELLSQDLIEDIYCSIQTCFTNSQYFESRQILCPTNDLVKEYNERIIEMVPGNSVISHGKNRAEGGADSQLYTDEFLQSIDAGSLPLTNLVLKRGVPVILLYNIDIASGLVNGTKCIVNEIYQYILKVTVVGKTEPVYIPIIDIMFDSECLPFTLIRTQFPVKVCFASTIHKSQGQSYDRVGIDVSIPVFEHGQLYVAISRCKYRKYLKIKTDQNRKSIQNIVDDNILDNNTCSRIFYSVQFPKNADFYRIE